MDFSALVSITEELWASRRSRYHKKHGREIYFCEIDQDTVAKQLIQEQRFQLFEWQPNNLTLRFPERCLLDLSRFPIATGPYSPREIFDMWNCAQAIAEELSGKTKSLLISGNHQQTAIYFCGPNIEALDGVSKEFYRILSKSGFKANSQLPSCVSCNDNLLSSIPDVEISSMFLSRLSREYSQVFGDQIMQWISFPLAQTVHATLPIWHWIDSHYQTVLFVLHAGTPLFLQYLFCPLAFGNVHVTEIHAENDPYKFLRNRPLNNWVFPKIMGDSPCLIIDKAFSGTTLTIAKDIMPPGSHTLALYPKTFSALMQCDYAVFGEYLLTHSSFSSLGLTEYDWVVSLLKSIHQIGEEVRCDGN